MSLVTLIDIAVAFGAEEVLRAVSCQVTEGARVGLVGRNGVGKTTLLRVIAGDLEPSGGARSAGRGARIALLEQVPTVTEARSVWEEALSAMRELLELERSLQEAAAALANSSSAAARYVELEQRFEASGGFTYRVLVKDVLTGLGFSEAKFQSPASQLSGGERSRLALAKALLARPDVLLLDEPTNHLDLDGLHWLEGFLGRWRASLVVSSHDRYFLDQVVSSIWYMEFGRLEEYPGTYSKFENLHAASTARRQREFQTQQEFIEKEEGFIRRYKAGQRAREARGRQKRLERVERLESPETERALRLRIGATRTGDLVLSTRGCAVGYVSNPVLNVPELEVERGERIALLGPNGSGKSTLLKTIAGALPPVDGAFRRGANVRPAHYWQEGEDLDPRSNVLNEVLRARRIDRQAARDVLGRFLFSGDDVDKPVSALSGGERSRLALVRLVLADANLLLLDEPTNHLDIPSREALEEALAAYEGTFIFASHDRRLIGRLATRLWIISDASLTDFNGPFDEYERSQREPAVVAARDDRGPQRRQTAKSVPKQPTPAHRDDLEDRIRRCEEELAALGDEVNQASSRGDMEAVRSLGERFSELQAENERLLDEWARSD